MWRLNDNASFSPGIDVLMHTHYNNSYPSQTPHTTAPKGDSKVSLGLLQAMNRHLSHLMVSWTMQFVRDCIIQSSPLHDIIVAIAQTVTRASRVCV